MPFSPSGLTRHSALRCRIDIMNTLLVPGLILALTRVGVACWLCWQLLRQNGRILLRLEVLEKRFEQGKAEKGHWTPETDAQTAAEQAAVNGVAGDQRAERFGNRSLAGSKLKRDGLKMGTIAPEFRLPRLEGGKLTLSELRGRFVLLVFSSPKCGPCNALAPKLERFHRKFPELELVLISQGEPQENRAKAKEHGLTFPSCSRSNGRCHASMPFWLRRSPISLTRPASSPPTSPWVWTTCWA